MAAKRKTTRKRTKKYYCRQCGNEKVKVLYNEFDENTGARVFGYECVNRLCPEDCDHDYGGFWNIFSNRCKKCGQKHPGDPYGLC